MHFAISPANKLAAASRGSQLGLLKTDAADIAIIPASELTTICPPFGLLYLPFLFTDRRSAEAVMEGAVGKELLEALEKEGVKGLGYYVGPSLQLCSKKRIVLPKDMGGLRLGFPESRPQGLDKNFIKLLSAKAVTTATSELIPALNEGRIDGVISSLEAYNELNLFSILDNVTMLNYSFEPMVICASSRAWGRMGKKQREILASALRESAEYHRTLVVKNERAAKNILFKAGVSVTELIPEEIRRFRKTSVDGYKKMLPHAGGLLIAEAVEEADKNEEPYLYRFYDNIDNARVIVPSYSPRNYPEEKLSVNTNGSLLARQADLFKDEERYCIFCPVPSTLEYEVRIPRNARLSFGIAVRAEAQEEFSAGLNFSIYLEGKGQNTKEKLFSKWVIPGDAEHAKRWSDEILDIKGWRGKEAKLVFSVSPGAKQRKKGGIYYAAVWANPVLYEVDESVYHRNLILISADTLRADRLHCYGNSRETSPYIDKLAGEGAMFANCIAQCTWTLPSQTSMFTSLYNQQHRRDGPGPAAVQLDQRYLTVAEILRDHAYNTTAIVESGYLSPKWGFSQGFNRYIYEFPNDPRAEELVDYGKKGRIGALWKDNKERKLPTTVLKAMEWLEQNKNRKFFLFFHTYQTHLPYFPNPYVKQYDSKFAGRITDTPDWEEHGRLTKEGMFNQREVRYLCALYDAQVRLLDDFMEVLMKRLGEVGLDKNTLVLFTSDHGEYIWSHGIFLDHSMLPYEDVVKVPLILRCNTIVPEGKKIEQLVRLIDVPPTLLDFAGVEIPHFFEGISLYPYAVSTEGMPGEEPVYIDGRHPTYHVGFRTADRKFIYYPGSGKAELYDIRNDPGELRDLSRERGEETRKFTKMAKEYISKYSWGYFLIFPEGSHGHDLRGKLMTDGIFSDILCHGTGADAEKLKERIKQEEAAFEISGEQPTIINFDVFPPDASVTLDIEVDGKRNPQTVFLAEEMRNPSSLPCTLDRSMRLLSNPFQTNKGQGCYAGYIPPAFLVDNQPRSSFKPIGGASRPLTPEEDEKLRPLTWDEEELKKLKALGYLR